jgi:hydrogenase maturation protein HypF
MSGTAEHRSGPLPEQAGSVDRMRIAPIATADTCGAPNVQAALRITLSGHVQGVGFRPFVYRLAKHHGLTGEVQNRLGEVQVIARGSDQEMRAFQRDLIARAPPLSKPKIDEVLTVDAGPFDDFVITASSAQANARIFVPPDYFMCDDCRRELHDPEDRRYRYPFINCTQCGPRYTLIQELPYDRPNTSMANFPLCAECNAEYQDPADRRFHAEPVACPVCGPQIAFGFSGQESCAEKSAALDACLSCLREGQIVAVKGIGGYHLMCDAGNRAAVATLRRRKQRPDKPLAVMFPVAGADGLDVVRHYADLSDTQAAMISSPVRPIVLANKRSDCGLADNIAPGLQELGMFLPYSPLHQLLLEEFSGPLVATSGNISGEPVLTGNDEAASRLAPIADAFLHHNRPIVRPADDPVYRNIGGSMRPLRIGRGCAPRELTLRWRQRQPVLAVGGHMKGTVALSWDDRVVVSPHIGEMDSPRSLEVFEQVAANLQALYGVQAERLVCDAHPGYTTHRWAKAQETLPVESVWHHRAHASALAAEHAAHGNWLVFTWDGVGYGEDGTLWGGEAFLGEPGSWRRVCSMRPFRLPGGERAGREPWRSAAALHWECGLTWQRCPDRDGLAENSWVRQLNSPETSAAGRLFDAAAALICDLQRVSFEAQGPMYLESLCREPRAPVKLPLNQVRNGILRTDWQPLLAMLTNERRSQAERAEVFHSSMAFALLEQARRIRANARIDHVGLCGGVFQNRVLTEQLLALLEEDGFAVFLSKELPCNDAALSFGQAAELAAREHSGES